MRVLALDATTRQGSVALVDDDTIVDERPGDAARSHAERLPGELLALVDARGLALDAVDLFAVASGPGSFTGLRIGIATIQGLAFVTNRPVVAVSTLEAVAQLAADALGAIVGAWIDAQRGEVFSALYRTGEAPPFTARRLTVLDPPSVGEPEATIARWQAIVGPLDRGSVIVAGDGAARYADVLRAGGVGDVRLPATLAGAIGRLAIDRAAAGETVGPAGIRPEYVRRPDAEIERERRAAAPPR